MARNYLDCVGEVDVISDAEVVYFLLPEYLFRNVLLSFRKEYCLVKYLRSDWPSG